MKHKNYSKFSKPFEKKAKQDKPMEGQITIDEVVNNTHIVTQELEETVVAAGGEVMRVEYEKGIITGCEKLNLREKPSKDGKVLAVLNKGTEVEVYTQAPTTPDFYKVKTASGLEGYCMKQFITIK